jgi:hypothetical protein
MLRLVDETGAANVTALVAFDGAELPALVEARTR